MSEITLKEYTREVMNKVTSLFGINIEDCTSVEEIAGAWGSGESVEFFVNSIKRKYGLKTL